jgi:hypothetical protein
MRTARATIKGFEVMRMVKKGRFSLWIEAVAGQSLEGRNAQVWQLSGRRHCAARATEGWVHHFADGSPSPRPFPE